VAAPGRRLAVNLTGVSHADVTRGDALVRGDQWEPTTTADCSLQVLATLDHDVSRRGAYQAYIGSGEHAVAVRVLGRAAVAAGSTGFVRLHLPRPLPLLPGDRYVLRESGRGETVGGGEVLDVAPVLPASKAHPTRSVERVVAERGWVPADLLERLTGERVDPTVGPWVVAPAARDAIEEAIRSAVAAAGPLGVDSAALSERQRALLPHLDGLAVSAGRVLAAGAGDAVADHPYVSALEATPFAPPPPDGVDRGELRELVRRGLVIERDGTWFAPSAVDEAARTVARLLAASPAGVTVSQVRDALGTSRKYLLPLLAHLDASGVTRRRGDLRVGGPRLPAV
jgi:selenocysteine-specific elongation factor